LRELLKQLEKMREILRKHQGDITLESPKDRQVSMSKLIPFLFQFIRKISRRMICNNSNNHHYIKRNTFRNKFQREFIFPIRSA